jgi:hypothetical protein
MPRNRCVIPVKIAANMTAVDPSEDFKFHTEVKRLQQRKEFVEGAHTQMHRIKKRGNAVG